MANACSKYWNQFLSLELALRSDSIGLEKVKEEENSVIAVGCRFVGCRFIKKVYRDIQFIQLKKLSRFVISYWNKRGLVNRNSVKS